MWGSRHGRGIVAATALILCFGATPAPAVVGPGDPAPDFRLNDLSGVPHALADLRGRVVLLAFVGYG